jgi:hypothetical protein
MKNDEYWEFSLKADIDKLDQINYIKERLKKPLKEARGVVTTICSQESVLLLVGVNMAYKLRIKGIICSLIANLVATIYKKEYITRKFNFVVKHDLMYKSFLKALISFDSDVDRQIIYNKLICFDNIVLQSFVDFKLKDLKQKWNELIMLANDNYMYLLSGGNFLELLKFLLSNLECKVDKVCVKKNQNGKYVFLFTNNYTSLNSFEFPKSAEDVVTSLIDLCPNKITIINQNDFSKEITDFLSELFGAKIEIIE